MIYDTKMANDKSSNCHSNATKTAVKTYVGETMKVFGISQAILYFGLAFFFGKYDLWHVSFPLYILVYAVTCFI